MLRQPDEPEAEGPLSIRNQFPVLFSPGKSYLLVGKRGTGKSWTLSVFASCALTYDDWIVASNVPIQAFDESIGDFRDARLDGYFYVDNYLSLFEVIAFALERRVKVFFGMDEGTMGESFQAGETRQKGSVRDSITFTNIARHLNVSAVMAFQGIDDVGTAWRDFEGGKLDAIIDKPMEGEFPGYSPKELVRFTNHAGHTALRYVPSYKLAQTSDWARQHPGTAVYVDAISGFTLGRYPGTEIAFRLREMMNAMIGKRPGQYPAIIREFLRPPPEVARQGRRAPPREVQAVAAVVDRVEATLEEPPREPLGDEKRRLLECFAKGMSVTNAMQVTGAGRTWAYQVFREYRTGLSTEEQRARGDA